MKSSRLCVLRQKDRICYKTFLALYDLSTGIARQWIDKMAWTLLVIAGLLEAGWAIGLKYTEGFTKPVPSFLTILAIIASMYLLALSARTLPIGTAYAVWVGIGTFGTIVLGIIYLGEPVNAGRIFFLILLMIAIIGLKITAQ